ncbi:MAG: class B sortase [Oscillospiraceae bacterium]
MSENKNIQNPFFRDENKELNSPQQPTPAYYPYPPMPPQAQQGENGQPMPMYYPYPPMPQQTQQAANEPNKTNAAYIDQAPTQNAPQEPQKVEQMPTAPISQPVNNSISSTPNPFATIPVDTSEKLPGKSEQVVDGREVFVRQPVIDTSASQNQTGTSGKTVFEKDELIVSEPRRANTIYSSPTPIFDPIKGIAEEQNVQQEETREDAPPTTNSFLSSMKNLYSAIGANGSDSAQNLSENVSAEPLPDFTAPIETVESDVQQIKTVYSAPATQTFEPVEVDMTKHMQSKTQTPDKTEVQQEQQFSLNRMLEQQEQSKPVEVEMTKPVEPQQVEPQQVEPQQVEQKSINTSSNLQTQPQQEKPIEVFSSSFQDTPQEDQAEEQDIEKDKQYWEFMNNLLDRFDDGKVHTTMGENPTPPPVDDAQQLQRKIQAIENEAQPDQGSLSDFGKNVEKPASDRVVIPRTPSFFKKSVTDFDMENPSFEEDFEELEDTKNKKREKAVREKKESVKREKVVKEKAPRAKKERNSSKAPTNSDSKLMKVVSSTVPMKGDSVGEIIRKVVVIVSVIVLLGCGIYFLAYFVDQQKNKNDAEELSKMMISSQNDEWSTIREKYPKINFPSGMQPQFADLYAINQDLVGWIKIKGLDINLPVVKGQDNEYYLKHNFNKEKSKYGSIFLSKDNNVETLDLNTVLFGHRMHSDTEMFTNLKEYATPEGFKKAPVIEFNTIYGNYSWKVYAVFITNGTASGDNGNVFRYTFPNLATLENYGQFLAEVTQRKLYDTGIEILPTDKLLTLSTCTYEFDGARLVVLARQVRSDETTDVDTSKIQLNKNPRYPQAWYDEKGVANPYKNFGVWEPVY